ncbi:MAG TPA: alpha/beta hydrolase [Sporichthya sp.]|nr:alpha/beta hydrolase [Sporichthya sp.]
MRSRYTIPLVASLTLAIGVVGAIGANSLYSVADEARPAVRHYGYGENPGNDLDLYLPAAVAVANPGLLLTPTVVLVHGGSWTRGDKQDMEKQAQQLVEVGYVAISVNYRLAPQYPWPAQRKDLTTALKWVRAHALDLHVDTSRMVVLGSSAGGEIAAAALTDGAGRKLARGLITMSAPFDLGLVAQDTSYTDESAELAVTVGRDLLACGAEGCDSEYEQRSVFNHIDARDPPTLLFASQRDWVDPQSSIRFHQVALAQGVESRLVVFQGKRHGMAYWREAWPIVREWLAQRMAAS